MSRFEHSASGRRVRAAVGAAAMVAGLVLAQPAGAAPVTYTEGSDLSNLVGSPTVVGALDIGLNSVTGAIACSLRGCNFGDPRDYFQFTLGAGLRITEITYEVSNYAATASGNFGRFGAAGSLDAATGSFSRAFGADVGPTTVFSGAANGPGDLTFLLFTEAPLGASNTISWNYTVGVTVAAIPAAPVPEPATLALLGIGVAGLAAVRRRPARAG